MEEAVDEIGQVERELQIHQPPAGGTKREAAAKRSRAPHRDRQHDRADFREGSREPFCAREPAVPRNFRRDAGRSAGQSAGPILSPPACRPNPRARSRGHGKQTAYEFEEKIPIAGESRTFLVVKVPLFDATAGLRDLRDCHRHHATPARDRETTRIAFHPRRTRRATDGRASAGDPSSRGGEQPSSRRRRTFSKRPRRSSCTRRKWK